MIAALTGPAADGPLAQAGLRRPGGGPPPGAEGLPAVQAPLFDVLGPHHVDHVLASWYAADRRSDVLVAVDVSGSMQARAPGSDRKLIDVVRDGIGGLASLLPDDSQLTLWRFGSRLDGERDFEPVLRGTTLDGEGRAAVSRAVGSSTPWTRAPACTTRSSRRTRRPGTRPARTCPATSSSSRTAATRPTSPRSASSSSGNGWWRRRTRSGPSSSPWSRSAASRRLRDQALAKALEPVDGYLDALRTADEVKAAFIHAAAGGIHE